MDMRTKTCGTCDHFGYDVYNDGDDVVYPQPVCELKMMPIIDTGNRILTIDYRENEPTDCLHFQPIEHGD